MTNLLSPLTIARRLTDWEKAAVMWLPGNGTEKQWWRVSTPNPEVLDPTLTELTMIGYGFDCYRLTELGVKVRQALEDIQEGDRDD